MLLSVLVDELDKIIEPELHIRCSKVEHINTGVNCDLETVLVCAEVDIITGV